MSTRNRFLVPTLVTGMIITGACNSLWSKYQDMQCVENCDDPDPKHHILYTQPIWQTLLMFLGEMLCFLPMLYTSLSAHWRSSSVQLPDDNNLDDISETQKIPLERLTGRRIFLLWLPALCDLAGSTLMNVGLLYTPVSIYTMTRGALVLSVGILSVLFLGRRLFLYQWLSLATVMAGVSLVGFSRFVVKHILQPIFPSLVHLLPANESIDKPDSTNVVIGVFFVLFAQIFTASQFVIEEKILGRYAVPPLLVVGYEGLFGTITIILLLPLLPLIKPPSSSTVAPWFDLVRGWHQLVNTPSVLYSSVFIACSIALYNYFGLSVTKHVSATVRSLNDTCRTLAIWVVSLLLGWEVLVWPISLLQVIGFGLLVYGTFLFNNLVQPPRFLRPSALAASSALPEAGLEDTPLLSGSVLDETTRLPAYLDRGRYDVGPAGQGATGGRSGR